MLKGREGQIREGGEKKEKSDRIVGLICLWLRMCPSEVKKGMSGGCCSDRVVRVISLPGESFYD